MKANILLSSLALVLLSACGGSGGKDGTSLDNNRYSKLYDSEVIGVGYENLTSGKKGKTNEKGFPYKLGDEVRFFVGSLTLGSTKVTSDKVFLPKLFGLDEENIKDEEVIKVARLLQALDSDKTDKIITINEDKIPQKIKNINTDITKIEVNKDVLDLDLPRKEEALKELQETLEKHFTKKENKVIPEKPKAEEKKEENKVVPEEPKAEEKKEENKVIPEEPKAEEKEESKKNNIPSINIPNSLNTNEDESKTISFTYSDADKDEVSAKVKTNPENGKVEINGTNIKYTPKTNFNGNDSFTLTFSDGNGFTIDKTIKVIVKSVNDEAIINIPNSLNTNEDEGKTISFTYTDADGDTISAKVKTNPENGMVTIDGTNIRYTPKTNFDGNDSFTLTFSDGNGFTTDKIIRVIVNNVNKIISQLKDINPTKNEVDENSKANTKVGITLKAIDVDNDIITYFIPNNIPFKLNDKNEIVIKENANLDYETKGSYTFIATATSSDGSSSTLELTIKIKNVNEKPIIDIQDSLTTNEDESKIISFTYSDADKDEVSAKVKIDPENGNVEINGTNIKYTPKTNFNGKDSFTLTFSDGNGYELDKIIKVTVNAINTELETDDSSSVDGIPKINTQKPYDINQSFRDAFKITADNDGQNSVPQDEKNNVKNMISTAGKKILETFPLTFAHLRGKGLMLGLAFNSSDNNIAAAVDTAAGSFKQDIYEGFEHFKKIQGELQMGLRINRYNTGTATIESTNNMISTITHETMHALMYETLSAGMTGRRADIQEGAGVKFPNWYIEGMAVIAGGGTKFVKDIIRHSSQEESVTTSGEKFIVLQGSNISTDVIEKEEVARAINNRDIKRGRKFYRIMNTADRMNVYGMGYLYLAYLGQLIEDMNEDKKLADSVEPSSQKIAKGLDKLMAMLAMGYSLDDSIRLLTKEKFTSTDDFENRAKDEVIDYTFKLIPKIKDGMGAVVTELSEEVVLDDIREQENSAIIINQNYTNVTNIDALGKVEFKGGGETLTGYSVDGLYPKGVSTPSFKAVLNGVKVKQ